MENVGLVLVVFIRGPSGEGKLFELLDPVGEGSNSTVHLIAGIVQR
jgi:hypothetical protein